MEELKAANLREVMSLNDEISTLRGKLIDIKDHMSGELAVNEVIQTRYQDYIGVLKNDLFVAKSILGNKELRDVAITDLNFEQVFYY